MTGHNPYVVTSTANSLWYLLWALARDPEGEWVEVAIFGNGHWGQVLRLARDGTVSIRFRPEHHNQMENY